MRSILLSFSVVLVLFSTCLEAITLDEKAVFVSICARNTSGDFQTIYVARELFEKSQESLASAGCLRDLSSERRKSFVERFRLGAPGTPHFIDIREEPNARHSSCAREIIDLIMLTNSEEIGVSSGDFYDGLRRRSSYVKQIIVDDYSVLVPLSTFNYLSAMPEFSMSAGHERCSVQSIFNNLVDSELPSCEALKANSHVMQYAVIRNWFLVFLHYIYVIDFLVRESKQRPEYFVQMIKKSQRSFLSFLTRSAQKRVAQQSVSMRFNLYNYADEFCSELVFEIAKICLPEKFFILVPSVIEFLPKQRFGNFFFGTRPRSLADHTPDRKRGKNRVGPRVIPPREATRRLERIMCQNRWEKIFQNACLADDLARFGPGFGDLLRNPSVHTGIFDTTTGAVVLYNSDGSLPRGKSGKVVTPVPGLKVYLCGNPERKEAVQVVSFESPGVLKRVWSTPLLRQRVFKKCRGRSLAFEFREKLELETHIDNLCQELTREAESSTFLFTETYLSQGEIVGIKTRLNKKIVFPDTLAVSTSATEENKTKIDRIRELYEQILAKEKALKVVIATITKQQKSCIFPQCTICQKTVLPEWFSTDGDSDMTSRHVRLDGWGFTCLGDDYKKVLRDISHTVSALDMSNNLFTSEQLVEATAQMVNLRKFFLSYNLLTTVNDLVSWMDDTGRRCHLVRLRKLYLDHNKIVSLPPSFLSGTQVEVISLRHNFLASVARENFVTEDESLPASIDYDGNPCSRTIVAELGATTHTDYRIVLPREPGTRFEDDLKGAEWGEVFESARMAKELSNFGPNFMDPQFPLTKNIRPGVFDARRQGKIVLYNKLNGTLPVSEDGTPVEPVSGVRVYLCGGIGSNGIPVVRFDSPEKLKEIWDNPVLRPQVFKRCRGKQLGPEFLKKVALNRDIGRLYTELTSQLADSAILTEEYFSPQDIRDIRARLDVTEVTAGSDGGGGGGGGGDSEYIGGMVREIKKLLSEIRDKESELEATVRLISEQQNGCIFPQCITCQKATLPVWFSDEAERSGDEIESDSEDEEEYDIQESSHIRLDRWGFSHLGSYLVSLNNVKDNICILNLNNNLLTSDSMTSVLSGMVRLEKLFLEYNKLTTVDTLFRWTDDEGRSRTLERLSQVSLGDNKISYLPSRFLYGTDVQTLLLNNNIIHKVDAESLKLARSKWPKSINLSYNPALTTVAAALPELDPRNYSKTNPRSGLSVNLLGCPINPVEAGVLEEYVAI